MLIHKLVFHLLIQLMNIFDCLKNLKMKFLQVVQEYERAVIFRLGRLLHGGSRGPGKIFP